MTAGRLGEEQRARSALALFCLFPAWSWSRTPAGGALRRGSTSARCL